MARVTVTTSASQKTVGGLALFAEDIPTSTMDAMLEAEADVVEPEIKRNADVMLHGKYWTGTTQGAVHRKAPTNATAKEGNGRKLVLTFKGSRNDYYHMKSKPEDKRNAAIAFINEYGKRGVSARPFVSKAVDDKEKEAQDAAEAVFEKWTEQL